MRKILLGVIISMLSVCSMYNSLSAFDIANVIITIEIDTEKSQGKKWDTINPWGVPPDVYGTIKFPMETHEIELHEDIYSLSLNYGSVDRRVKLNVGDSIYIELFDKDRGRMDDLIAKGNVVYNGDKVIETKIGFANIKIEFII